jgi:hypothetical protein
MLFRKITDEKHMSWSSWLGLHSYGEMQVLVNVKVGGIYHCALKGWGSYAWHWAKHKLGLEGTYNHRQCGPQSKVVFSLYLAFRARVERVNFQTRSRNPNNQSAAFCHLNGRLLNVYISVLPVLVGTWEELHPFSSTNRKLYLSGYPLLYSNDVTILLPAY